MQINSVENKVSSDNSGITVLCGSTNQLQNRPLVPFDEMVIHFLAEVSKDLLHNVEAKNYPDIITFAFFCRPASILQLKEKYLGRIGNRLGRGLVFHVAPSNVPINFAYSLTAGLLSGNTNIVKASSKDFAQTRIVSQAFQKILMQNEYQKLRPYINVVIYDRSRQDLTEHFSSICNVRVIWGGDSTIKSVRNAAIPPRSFDITFADRYSIAVINGEEIIKISNDNSQMKRLAQDFYNDTYLYDQNACTSPRLIYWLGNRKNVENAKQIFWSAVYENIKTRYPVDPEIAVDKMVAADSTAIMIPGSICEGSQDNRIVRIDIPELTAGITELRSAGGFFHEYSSETLDAVIAIVNEKYQTLSYFGIDANILKQFIIDNGLSGIDRIVPIGHTADFGFIWDGYDLVTSMSREVVMLEKKSNN